ncbi:MAG: 50S ribosomal protein L22 [Coriobacteriia bacterium]|nr:50S ribosomal protein L22 [Coriobacteriia bacterium]MCL2870400.1 50S ribosomal protein L22 [Coriobacteriia bacterium]
MQSQAIAKYVRISPRKARIVIDLIRGKSVEEARTILTFSTRAASEPIEKVLNSAVANAENKDDSIKADMLYVSGAFVDEGPTLKRIRAGAKGMAKRINKRTCHITIQLDTTDTGKEA